MKSFPSKESDTKDLTEYEGGIISCYSNRKCCY